MIVFHASNQKINIFIGSITVKVILSFLMTPIVYLIVIAVNRYLESNKSMPCSRLAIPWKAPIVPEFIM